MITMPWATKFHNVIARVLALVFCLRFAGATGPELLWSQPLSNDSTIEGEGLRKGNGVVLSLDEQSLWVTAESGSVHVYAANSGSILSSFQPEAIENHYTESRSSVSLYQPYGSVAFAVAAVIDIRRHGQHDDANAMISSRVFVLSGDSGNNLGTLSWSTGVIGAVEGTPLTSSDGSRIYVISNTPLHAIFTVLDSSDGSLVKQILDPRPMARYGPPSMVTNVNNGIDKVYWADASERGYAAGGRIHAVVSDFLSTVHSERAFASSSTVAPTVSSDGKSIWIGGRGATIHGWNDSSLHPVWSTQLPLSNRNESFPIVNTIETDDTESRLFVASASNSFHCLDAQNGNELWSTSSSSSVFMTGAKYSAEHNVVYSIEQLSGAVNQHDAQTGAVNWRMGCEGITVNPICQASVEADFSVAADGETVYYGDVYGRINAVKFPPPPTEVPSSAPSESPSSVPSAEPSTSPSSEPSALPSSMPSEEPSLKPSVGPSDSPSSVPSTMPSSLPSNKPSSVPSGEPSSVPSDAPSGIPSAQPSVSIAPSPGEVSPTTPKDTRGKGGSPHGQNPETWKPGDTTARFVPQTSSARAQTAWISAVTLAVSSILVISC